MAESTVVDTDLDALAPPAKRVRLAGKTWRLPGDLPMELFVKTQTFEARVAAGEPESDMLLELRQAILELFQVHQPTLKQLPAMGLVQMLKLLGHVYGPASAEGEPSAGNRATRRARTRTPSK